MPLPELSAMIGGIPDTEATVVAYDEKDLDEVFKSFFAK